MSTHKISAHDVLRFVWYFLFKSLLIFTKFTNAKPRIIRRRIQTTRHATTEYYRAVCVRRVTNKIAHVRADEKRESRVLFAGRSRHTVPRDQVVARCVTQRKMYYCRTVNLNGIKTRLFRVLGGRGCGVEGHKHRTVVSFSVGQTM